MLFHDVVALTQKLFPIVEAMQKHFSSGSGAYYSDAIFFLSVAMHRIMPESRRLAFCDISCQLKKKDLAGDWVLWLIVHEGISSKEFKDYVFIHGDNQIIDAEAVLPLVVTIISILLFYLPKFKKIYL